MFAQGLTCGSLLLGSGYMIAKTDKQSEAHLLAGVTTGAIAATAGKLFIKGAKFMPAGLVATLGAAGFAYNFKKFLEWEDAENGAIE